MAAAADLQPVMPLWAAAYEHATGVKLVVSFGSSSMLAEQILNGAPMDIFLGADFVFPEKSGCGGAGGWDESDGVCEGGAGGLGKEGFAAAAAERGEAAAIRG